MLPRWCLLSCLLLLIPMLGAAQTPIRIDDDDVYFQFSGIAEQSPHTGTNIASSQKPASNRLCGFSIRANHRSSQNPHIEWDINIDEIVTPSRTVAGVSAGTFEVTDHKRKPRPPITELSFALQGVADPIPADIKGQPNADNGIVALLESEPASRLFTEFQSVRPILIALRYSDGSNERLEVRGWKDKRKFGGGQNSYFNQCLQGFRVPVGGEISTKVP